MVSIFAVDFFCGVGGATKGFQNAGINVVKGIDLDPTCKETYEKNCSPAVFLHADINDLKAKDVLDGIHLSESDCLLFIACAPCQPFSRIASRSRVDANLILAFAKIVKKLKPHAIFIENVPGLADASKGQILRKLLRTLTLSSYQCEWRRVNAKYYGVPQNRSRFIMLASRFGRVPFPHETHGKNLAPYVTVSDAISEYPSIEAGEAHKDIPNHVAPKLSKLNLERVRNTPRDGGSRKDWPKRLWLECHKKSDGHSDVYGRMRWKKPAPTLTCKCNSISNGRFGHPEQNRAISLREAAALQSFSDDFLFYGANTRIARHIGNAVPPQIAEIFGRAISDFVSRAPETCRIHQCTSR